MIFNLILINLFLIYLHPKGDKSWVFIGRTMIKAEVDWPCEDLQDLLELTPRKDNLFIVGY